MQLLFVGCYTVPMGHCPKAAGKGVSIYALSESESGVETRLLSTTDVGPNPSFLAFAPKSRRLFVCSEDNPREGTLSTYHMSEGGSTLSLVEKQCSGGVDPCYVVVDDAETLLGLANYSSGSLLTRRLDGPADAVATHQLEGSSGVVSHRQEGPHAHCFVPSSDWGRAYVCDLGNDAVYAFHLVDGALEALGTPFALPPGSGPRHLILHPNGNVAYVAGELDNAVHVLRLSADGTPSYAGACPTLPPDWAGENTTADLHLSPDARHLFVSNRGHDSLAAFAVSEDGLGLESRGHVPTGGHVPRNFTFTPSGRFLLVANQDSDNVVVFAFDEDSGRLSPTGQELSTPAPVCLKIHRI